MLSELMLVITLFKVKTINKYDKNNHIITLNYNHMHAIKGWEKRFPNDPTYKTSKLVEKMVKEGKLGQKSGEGWYKYKK